MPQKTIKLNIENQKIQVCLSKPTHFTKAIIIANGAGAAMDSPFISYFHKHLAARGFLTIKFNFIYQECGRRVPDRAPLLERTYLRVYQYLIEKEKLAPADIVLSGKSMGGRIASQIISQTGSKKLVLLGYPLYPAGRPEKIRDEHLYAIRARMLFCSGERDPMCDPERLHAVLSRLKRARLHSIPLGDHSFKTPKKGGRPQEEIFDECITQIVKFVSAKR